MRQEGMGASMGAHRKWREIFLPGELIGDRGIPESSLIAHAVVPSFLVRGRLLLLLLILPT